MKATQPRSRIRRTGDQPRNICVEIPAALHKSIRNLANENDQTNEEIIASLLAVGIATVSQSTQSARSAFLSALRSPDADAKVLVYGGIAYVPLSETYSWDEFAVV